LLISIVLLALLYVLFQDYLLLSITIAITAISLYSLFIALHRARKIKDSVFEPSSIKMKMIAGNKESIELNMKTEKPIRISLKHPLKFCNIKPNNFETNNKITIEISPKLAGIYETEYLEAEIISPMKAFAIRKELAFKTSLTVMPRLIPALLRALELLAMLGTRAYETPSITIGRGTEYAETREYLLGDDLKRMDWKATARLQKLMVKQFYQDEGGKMNLVYDLKTAGPITRDKIAREFLETAMALTQDNIPYNIIIIKENETKMINFENHKKALMIAIRYALETIKADYKILYELIEPQSSKEIINLLKLIEEDLKIEEIIPRAFEPTDTIAISCLLGDLTWLTSMHEKLEYYNKRLMLRIPSEIYLDSETLEQAYEDYEKQMKLIATLKKRGIEVRIKQ